ncbi:Crp/Fnr family transcriptional regulator [Orbus wheelerorum]|uniref:Crp/Fnr family transcriptional regulator n=1 Tax=Orbus wheelerorum TaxID=3074111 RepID=UPI00370D66A0
MTDHIIKTDRNNNLLKDVKSTHKILVEYFLKNHSLNEKEILFLVQLFTYKSVKRDIRLIEEGQVWDKVYIVKSGILRFYYTTPCGKFFNKGFFNDGNIIWPITPSSRSKPSLFNIETLTDCDVWVASFYDFREALMCLNLWEQFSFTLIEAITEEKFIREYEFLVNDAESRFTNLKKRIGHITERIADYHTASYLGISPVALSRIKKRLKN